MAKGKTKKKKKKLSRKEVLAPDEFLTKSRDILKIVTDYWRPLLLGGGAILLLAVAAVSVEAYFEHSAEIASGDLARALDMLDAPIVEEGADVPKGRDGEPVKVHFPSEEARRDAARKALTELIDAHSGTELARTARLLLADVDLSSDDVDGAIKVYQDFLADPTDVPVVQYLAMEDLGYAYEDSGDLDKALTQFQRMAADVPENPLRDEALFEVGRIQEDRGDRDAARAAYTELTERFPESRHAQKANARLALLSGGSAGEGAAPAPTPEDTSPAPAPAPAEPPAAKPEAAPTTPAAAPAPKAATPKPDPVTPKPAAKAEAKEAATP